LRIRFAIPHGIESFMGDAELGNPIAHGFYQLVVMADSYHNTKRRVHSTTLKSGQLGHGVGINCFGSFGQFQTPHGFPAAVLGKIRAYENARKALIFLARSERFELPTLRFEV
jgi:hypothetical protein